MVPMPAEVSTRSLSPGLRAEAQRYEPGPTSSRPSVPRARRSFVRRPASDWLAPPVARACRGGGRRRAAGGYTLIEVIVAFALLALALTLLLGTLSGATRQVRWSGDAGRAALHAQSLLDTVGVGAPLQAGRSDGEFDDGRYRWSLAVAPWDEPLSPDAPRVPVAPAPNRLYEIALTVQWGDGGPRERLELRSLRLAPAPAGDALP